MFYEEKNRLLSLPLPMFMYECNAMLLIDVTVSCRGYAGSPVCIRESFLFTKALTSELLESSKALHLKSPPCWPKNSEDKHC